MTTIVASMRWPRAPLWRGAVVGAFMLTVPGLLLGMGAATLLWRWRGTPNATRWGWASLSAVAVLGVPHPVWVAPIQLAMGARGASVLTSAVMQALVGPLAAMLLFRAPSGAARAAPLGLPAAGAQQAGVLLGRDASGRPVTLDLAGEATVAVIGQSGTGKTVDLIALVAQAVRLGWSAVVLDLKAGASLKADLGSLAAATGFPLSVFDPDDPHTLGFNPCAGSPDRVANALVSSFLYTGIADVYAQVALVMITAIVATHQALGKSVTIESIVESFDEAGWNALSKWARQHPPADPGAAQHWLGYLDALIKSGKTARVIAEGHVGMKSRLAALTQGGFGPLLRQDDAIDLAASVAQCGITYFGLSALARPTDVALVGNVLIQTLKQLAAQRHRQRDRVPCLVVIDEVPSLGDPAQLDTLLLQAREGGMTVVAASQFLPEDRALRATLLGAGVVIAHRVAAPDAAPLAEAFGEREVLEVRPSFDYTMGTVTRAMVQRRNTFTITPDQLRNLERGQAAVRIVRNRPAERAQIVWMHKEEMMP